MERQPSPIAVTRQGDLLRIDNVSGREWKEAELWFLGNYGNVRRDLPIGVVRRFDLPPSESMTIDLATLKYLSPIADPLSNTISALATIHGGFAVVLSAPPDDRIKVSGATGVLQRRSYIAVLAETE